MPDQTAGGRMRASSTGRNHDRMPGRERIRGRRVGGHWANHLGLLAAAVTGLLLVAGVTVALPPVAAAAATCTGNEIVCENQLPGTDPSFWYIQGAGDDSIQGFATQISVNRGETVQFKIKTDAP